MIKFLLLCLIPMMVFSGQLDIGKNEKNIGIEVNPFRVLLQESDHNSLSGSLSFFLEDQNTEIRFPFFWDRDTWDGYSDTTTTIDTEYRYYIDNSGVGGLFIGGLARLAMLDNEETNKDTMKLGAGFTLGYRYMPEGSNWYAGVSISVIRYFSGENHIFGKGGIDTTWLDNDTKGIIDVDLFKIGYRF
ncbi:MAG: hypothetical protein Q9M39_03185 [Sulfurovum sp.]|nr:hypothetical protein [Sulfurovum sp.]